MFPQVNQRFFAAGSKAVLKRSFALWPILCVLLFVPSFMLGAWAAGLEVAIPEGANVLPLILDAYTPTWFAALIIAGAMAAMMSSSDSMLLSGSSYFTRDLYRPFVDRGLSDSREGLLARGGVAIFATAAFVASLFQPATLFELGNAAFSGFAQLALPVLLALYWRKITRAGITTGILASQGFYMASLFVAAVPGSYAGWSAGLVGMGLGLLVTVVVSLVTSPAADEQRAIYFDGLGAD